MPSSLPFLMDYTQADMEGIMVNVSRQAIHEVADELIEATAELIYLREYGKDGAVWWANEAKDVWREKARALLSDKSEAKEATDESV